MSTAGNPLPTPECIDVSSVTPDSVKSPTPPPVATNAPEAAASTNTDAPEEDRSGSPPPSCPICLGTYKNKCFTDSCLHQFCFNCLLEWSKIKAECPLCKQSFKSIIHNVKSEREFEEYLVQQPLHYNLMLSEPFRFSYSTTLQVRPSQSEALQRLFLHHPSLTDRYVYPRNERPNVRRRIYERGLYALPLYDITGRARECSAEFYRSNAAQVHRLIPFLNREAIHVIQDPRSVSSLMQRATEILTSHDITSPEFRRLMEPYFRENTVHFIHEFYNFARSPFDLYGYDNNVQYSQDYNLALQTQESGNASSSAANSSAANTSEQTGVRTRSQAGAGGVIAGSSRNNNRTGGPGGSSSSALVVTDIVSILSSSSSSSSNSGSDDDSARPSTSTAATGGPGEGPSASAAAGVSVIQTTFSSSSGANQQPSTSAPTLIKTEQQRVESVIRTAGEPSVKIELSDTDSEEVQFVKAIKPPHLRTPEYMSLNSDEDSDVVFVNQSTDGPVLPTKELPRHQQLMSAGGGSTNSPMNLMDDSRHMPLFMPYMYGMDTPEPGPSTGASGGGNPHGQASTAGELKPNNSSELNFKYEDPMFGGPSSSAAASHGSQRRKRRSQRRPTQFPSNALIYTSSDEDQEAEEQEEEEQHEFGPTSSRRRRIAAPPNYAANDSSSEEDGNDHRYTLRDLQEKMQATKKKNSPGSRKNNMKNRNLRRKRARTAFLLRQLAMIRNAEAGEGTSTQMVEPYRSSSSGQEEEKEKDGQRDETLKKLAEETVRQKDEEKRRESQATTEEEEEDIQVDGDDQPPSGASNEEQEQKKTLASGEMQRSKRSRSRRSSSSSSSNSSNNQEKRQEGEQEEDDDEEEDASNQGSVATSGTQSTGGTNATVDSGEENDQGEESEDSDQEIDVQNDNDSD